MIMMVMAIIKLAGKNNDDVETSTVYVLHIIALHPPTHGDRDAYIQRMTIAHELSMFPTRI